MKRVNRTSVLIGLILLLALLIRVWSIGFGLPYLYHPDEPNKIAIAQNMFKTGDLNPHYFYKPTLFIYLNALAYIPYYSLGKLLGAFNSPTDILPPVMLTMGVGVAPIPTAVLMGRLLTTIFATASVFMIFVIGRQISDKASVGLLSAFIMSISITNVANSRFVTENSFVVFFSLVVTWAAIHIYQRGETRDYIIAGIATGFAVSSKYPGGVIGILPLIAHFMHPKRKGIRDYRLYLALIFIPIAFFATTPFALLDYKEFLEDTLYEVGHYSTGHAGMEGNSLIWYLSYMWRTAGAIYILAVLGIIHGFYSRSKDIIFLSIFPLVYFVFISSFAVRNDRTLLPMTPFMFLLAASFWVRLLDKAKGLPSKVARQLSIFTTICLLIISLVLSISPTVKNIIQRTTADSRETARVWINANLPPGTKIAIESYSPFLESPHFLVQGIGKIIDYQPEWYIENGFDYLVFSQRMYGRYYDNPERYSVQISRYDGFFNRFTLERLFTDGGYEIRIYTTK